MIGSTSIRRFKKVLVFFLVVGIISFIIAFSSLRSDVHADGNAEVLDYETTPESILCEISERGARVVVHELYENGRAWDIVLDGIASGNPAWIKVANALRPGSDAGATSMLDVAMFLALEPAPELVLASLQQNRSHSMAQYSFDLVCSSNFLIDFPTDDHALRLLERRIHILEKISDHNLLKIRDACIDGLQRAFDDTRKLVEEIR